MQVEQFWSHVDKSGECWIWMGAKLSSGYGMLRFNGQIQLAHRVAYELDHHMPAPMTLCVLHRCDNPPCVNPQHLWLGTRTENQRDMQLKGRSLRGERQPLHKLTAQEVLEIKKRYENAISLGVSKYGLQTKLAKEFELSRAIIKHIVHGTTWGWLH